jgi:hypothetical protein
MSTPDPPLRGWTPADLFRAWLPPAVGAPNTLVQPILPGWTLNVNSQNSSSPQTEANVVARHSYGRQIGRLADAVRALIVERHGEAPAEPAFAEFMALWREIEQVKLDSATARLEAIESDLALLERSDPKAYERLRSALRDALKRTA